MTTPTMAERRTFAKSGVAMPDGSFYIRNRQELSNAIEAVGRATPNAGESDVARRNSVRRHIMKRARALNLTSMIPDTWNPDGSLKHGDLASEIEAWLAHYGVLGMKWGVRRRRGTSSSGSRSVSPEAARAIELHARAKAHGTSSLSNAELKDLVNRLNLETQYGRMNQSDVSRGRQVTHQILKQSGGIAGNVAKTTVTAFAAKYAAQGVEHLIKQAAKGKG